MQDTDEQEWLYSFYAAAERRAWLQRPLHEQPRDYAVELRRELIHGPRPWWKRAAQAVWRWLSEPTDL